ncbi:hypothetical protein YC2023_098168 [Brassica napus]
MFESCTLCIFQIKSCREVIESHIHIRGLIQMKDSFTSYHHTSLSQETSRGIDFTGVDHVVLFNFQCHPSEYVRGVGRTARGVRPPTMGVLKLTFNSFNPCNEGVVKMCLSTWYQQALKSFNR